MIANKTEVPVTGSTVLQLSRAIKIREILIEIHPF
jgi:hypothetical protein